MTPVPLLSVRHLSKRFPIRQGVFRRVTGAVRAVDDVSFDLRSRETLGLVGESGCGKTTTGRCIVRLIAPSEGKILFGTEQIDLAKLTPSELRPYRKRIQMIFQDPQSSLNPRMTVGDIVAEPLHVNRLATGSELEGRVAALLHSVGLQAEDMRRYPHAFSGGQRQRIGIARALSLQPELIVADEPVSALDVSVQAQILNLLVDLREQYGLAYLFIAHNLNVVEHISQRVAVMYLGRIVEMGPTEALYDQPRHPYTEALLSAVPMADPVAQKRRQRIRLQGDVPDPAAPPPGCAFHLRCRYVTDQCRQERPDLREMGGGVQVACHHAETLALRGTV